MSPRVFALLCLLPTVLLPTGVVGAQQPAKIYRIGYVAAASGSSSTMLARAKAFRQGLSKLGYVEGKNIVIEWRFAEGKVDRIAALVAELTRLKVDIILSGGPEPTRVAKEATVTIPIVMTQDPILLEAGLLPAWRGLEATSLDCQLFLRS